MAKGILGKKLGMTQIFLEDGTVIPVTVIEAGPCFVSQIRTNDRDGYSAVQIGFSQKKEYKANKPEKGHFSKAQVLPCRFIREINFDNADDFQLGQELLVDLFAEGDLVDITGTSRGKGFTGMTKLGFQRGPTAHGSKYHRRVGSLGAKGPARVFKGRPLPGRTGGDTVTVQNLHVVRVDKERNLLLVKGAIPGAKKGYLIIKSAVKNSD